MQRLGSRDGRCAAIFATVSLCLFDSTPAYSELWYIQPQASLYTFWEDNIRLTVDDQVDSPGVIARGELKAGQTTETTEIEVGAAVVAREYFSESDLNTVDFYFDALGAYRLERSSFELGAEYVNDSTLTSEEATTGLLLGRNRRNRWQLAPGWTYELSERATVSAEFGYEEVDYENDARFSLSDYTYAAVGVGTTYRLTERTVALGQVDFAQFETKDDLDESTVVGLMVGLAHELSETTAITVLAGARQADTSSRGIGGSIDENESSGATFDLGLNKRFEVGFVNVGLSRGLVPSGRGELLDTVNLSVRWVQPITSRWRWSLEGNAYRNEQPSGEASTVDRDFFSLTPKVSYSLDEDWSVAGAYRYRYQEYDFDSSPADSHAVFVTLRWVPLIER